MATPENRQYEEQAAGDYDELNVLIAEGSSGNHTRADRLAQMAPIGAQDLVRLKSELGECVRALAASKYDPGLEERTGLPTADLWPARGAAKKMEPVVHSSPMESCNCERTRAHASQPAHPRVRFFPT